MNTMRASLLAVLAWLGASASSAQSFIPTIVGQTVANSGARASAACFKGKPPRAGHAKFVTAGAEKVMAEYAQARGNEDRQAVAALFAANDPTISLKTPEGPEGAEAVKAFFAGKGAVEPGQDGAAPKLVGIVVAGHELAATGLWETPAGGHYLVDIVHVPLLQKGGGWKILHLRLTRAGEPAPALPPQYCHKVGDVKTAD